jgi:hypothetical protein
MKPSGTMKISIFLVPLFFLIHRNFRHENRSRRNVVAMVS